MSFREPQDTRIYTVQNSKSSKSIVKSFHPRRERGLSNSGRRLRREERQVWDTGL